jgi:uridine phosphorylase
MPSDEVFMTLTAWYLGCRPQDVGDRAILVGDRGRVGLVADRLENPEWLNENRGLTTVTGSYRGKRVTASAFGMGAPIAAVVLHELRALGVHTFIRLGTVMCLPPVELGQLVLADGAIRGESTSGTYVPDGFPAVGDHELCAELRRRLGEVERRWTAGLVATYDGFYSELFALEKERQRQIDARQEALTSLGVVATDMETSAVLAVGRALGARAASLCLASVDGHTREKLGSNKREDGERDLIAVGLDAITEIGHPDAPAATRGALQNDLRSVNVKFSVREGGDP